MTLYAEMSLLNKTENTNQLVLYKKRNDYNLHHPTQQFNS